jgi:hypothetical protein
MGAKNRAISSKLRNGGGSLKNITSQIMPNVKKQMFSAKSIGAPKASLGTGAE